LPALGLVECEAELIGDLGDDLVSKDRGAFEGQDSGPWRMPAPSMISVTAGPRCSMAVHGASFIARVVLRGDEDGSDDLEEGRAGAAEAVSDGARYPVSYPAAFSEALSFS
jgi:hypothetical protein